MSDQRLDDSAFPCKHEPHYLGDTQESTGLTKLEWAAVRIAAAMVVDGVAHASEEQRKQIAADAVALACEVLRQAAP